MEEPVAWGMGMGHDTAIVRQTARVRHIIFIELELDTSAGVSYIIMLKNNIMY